MYAIKMNDDKSLSATIKATIYQYEKNADTLLFLVPTSYEDVNLANCTMLLRYILPDGSGKSEELEMDPEPYKTYYQYRIKATTMITSVSGKIELWLSAIDLRDNLILKSGTTYIEVTPSKDIVDYFSGEDMEQLDRLSAKVALLEQGKADNIVYDSDGNYLQLTANGAPIGNQIDMESVAKDVADEVIDFNSESNDDGSESGSDGSDSSSGNSEDNDATNSDDVIYF